MEKSYFKAGISRMGFTPIWLVDEHGCQTHTEAVCTIPDCHAAWFIAWLTQQECPISFTPLLEHPFADTVRAALDGEDKNDE